jgi:hypothetical protein
MKAILILLLCCLTFGAELVYGGCGGIYLLSNKPSPISEGDSITIYFVVDGMTCPVTSNRQWYQNDSLIPGATNTSFVAKHTGIYKIKFLADGQLDSLLFELVVNPVGISDYSEKTAVKIFPNPSTGRVNIDIGTVILQNIIIFNSFGQKVFEDQPETFGKPYSCDLAYLPKGIYFIKVFSSSTSIYFESKIILR